MPAPPTLEQIKAFASPAEVRACLRDPEWCPDAFRNDVRAAALDLTGEEWPGFWRSTSIEDWRAVLTKALELSGAAAPAPAASVPDPTSPVEPRSDDPPTSTGYQAQASLLEGGGRS
jgi:hypothetical protein